MDPECIYICVSILLCWMIPSCTNSGASLLIGNFKNISKLDLDTLDVKLAVETTEVARFLDYHYGEGYLYWTNNYIGKIFRTRYPTENNSKVETVVTYNNPIGIAVDQILGHVYWTENFINQIMRCNLEGSNVTVTLDNLKTPYALTIDSQQRFLYYSQIGGVRNIERCRLDGTDRKEIVSSYSVMSVYGITIDYAEKKLYWADYTLDCFKSANLDGSNIMTLKSLNKAYGIAIYGNQIYCCSLSERYIIIMDKISGSFTNRSVPTLDTTGLYIYADAA